MKKRVMSQEEILIKKAKKISIKEGSFFTISEGFGMRYITPYALALGANNSHIGFLNSLPTMLGNFSKLLTPWFMERFSRRSIALFGASFQALMWLVVLYVGHLYFNSKSNAPVLLILVYSLLIMFGAFYGPAWSSWMKDLLTKNSGRYFGRRSKITGFFVLISMLIGGFILDYFKQTRIFIGFIILFGAAFLARSLSAFLFTKKYEPRLQLKPGYYFSFFQFLKRMPFNNFGRFVMFLAFVQLATAIASPFFTVYMLKDLQFSYVEWVIINISSSLISLLFLPVWGKFADRFGNLRVMKITGYFIPLVPLLWLFSVIFDKHIFAYLILVEAFSGFAWAGFNLSSSTYIYDAVSRSRMAICVAYSDILNGIGVFIGASLGGYLSNNGVVFLGLTPLLFVFFISFLARVFAVWVFLPGIREVREVESLGIRHVKKVFTAMGSEKISKYYDMLTRTRPL